MDSEISIPTDNIFKFYALFGLFFAIVSMVTSVSFINSTNDFIFEKVEKYAVIDAKEIQSKNDEEIKKILLKQIQSRSKDRDVSIWGLSLVFVISVLSMYYGFNKWHTEIQPKQDEYFDLQKIELMQKLGIKNEEELLKLKKEMGFYKQEKRPQKNKG